MEEKVLITGGAGYIGSHTVIKLLELNLSLVLLDNFSNSSLKVIDRIGKITKKKFTFIEGDITNRKILRNIFNEYKIKSVIHFAGLKSVEESEKYPIKYYKNNVIGSINLFEEMDQAKVKNIVFSSSATVYGKQINPKLSEETTLLPINNYGKTKMIIEDILKSISNADSNWRIVILRYFNPIGAHKSGIIGDNPTNYPNNLLPFISQVAVGKRKKLLIFGDDYPTPDGTGKRDYIHVDDIADAHSISLNYLVKMKNPVSIFNLGTGKSYSVHEVIKAYEKASGLKIPYEIVERRPGDIPECFADPFKAKDELGWEAKYKLEKMCADAWRWQQKNPNGI